MRYAAPLLSVAVTSALLVGCGADNRSCADSSDCFAGEVCNADLVCVDRTPPPNSSDASNADSDRKDTAGPGGGSDGGGGDPTPNGDTGGETGGETGQPNADAGDRSECVVDLFDYACDEDDWEPNDGYSPNTNNWDYLPWEANSWCVSSGTLVNVSRSLEGTLCAGDPGDAFRFLVTSPCDFDNQVKFTITVTLHTECDGSNFRVEPYTFGLDPIRNDLCANDDNVRCTVSADGRVHTIDWIFEEASMYDPRVQIMSEGNNIHLDYTVEFTITR